MPDTGSPMAKMNDREFKKFREIIHRETGIYLPDGKQMMLASRLARRLRHHGFKGFAAYADFVQQAGDGGKELAELINCVTTNKTSFFREKHHFDFLAQTLVPDLVAGAALGRKRNLRIWSAACSSGEEPYSIAISLLESLTAAYPSGLAIPGAPGGWEVEVVGSDIDTQMLERAARAIYDEDALADMPSELKGKYFLRGKDERAGQIRVKKEVCSLVKLVRINLMDSVWPIEGAFDAVFFRNALIYFARETQEVFLRRMLRYLKPGGYLVLGHSEHVPWLQDSVKTLGNTIHQLLPQKKPVSGQTGPN